MEGCIAQEQVESIITSNQSLIIVDVRDENEYAQQHIPQAINIPLDQLDQNFLSIEKDTVIITACGKGGGRSANAARQLQGLGFTEAKWLCGGTFGWV